MSKLVRQIKINHLEYNPNRDPQVYRRAPRQPFRIEVHLGGTGKARAKIEVGSAIYCNRSLDLPGVYTCEIVFDRPGTRLARFTVEGAGESYQRDLRLDVLEHEWVG
jgi:hypothetical protein